MVSVEYYLKRFVKVMPRRAKIIRSMMRKKQNLDKNLDKKFNRVNNDSDLNKITNNLISIIGKDGLFSIAEIKNRKTLRHYLWKFLKGFIFILKKKNFIIEKFETEPKYASQFFDIIKGIADGSENSLKFMTELDKIYILEIKALEKKNWKLYLDLVKKENNVLKLFGNYGVSFKIRQKGTLNFLKFYIKRLRKTEEGIGGFTLAVIISIMSLLFASALYFGIDPDPEDLNFYRGLILLMSSGPFLMYSIMIDDKNKLKQTIRDFVMQTV